MESRDEQKDTVSVIVPIYNDEKNIRSCMESIVHQTYTRLEIILVDDASEDASLEICLEYAKADERIVVLHNDKNCGLSESRERGYQYATGTWICFADHDDRMDLHAVENLIAAADDGTDIVAGKYKNVLSTYFESYERDVDHEGKVTVLEHEEVLGALGNFAEMDVPSMLWGKLYRRELFERIEISKYRERFSLVYFEDVLLTPRLMKECRRLKILNQYLYIHRIDYDSVSQSKEFLDFHLQAARAMDVVVNWVDEPYARHTYTKYMQGGLLMICKSWYLIWRYYDKNAALLGEMEVLFDKYYPTYQKLGVKKCSMADIGIRIFNGNKVFFSSVICKIYFQYLVKWRYRRLSK